MDASQRGLAKPLWNHASQVFSSPNILVRLHLRKWWENLCKVDTNNHQKGNSKVRNHLMACNNAKNI